jgi:hypothetical protein
MLMMSRRRVVMVAMALPLAVGCTRAEHSSETPASARRQASVQTAAASQRDPKDPCSLLQPADVEAITGPLAGPPYRTREGLEQVAPTNGGDTCVYEMPDFRTLLVTVTWNDGPLMMKALSIGGAAAARVANAPEAPQSAAKSLLPGGLQIDGEWDETRGSGCCEIYALRGDRVIHIDYRGWRADTERAVAILNKALLRLEHPLAVDGNAGNEPARQRERLRPKPSPVCNLLSRAEVEAILGPLGADPRPISSDETDGCTYRFTQTASKDSPFTDRDTPKPLTGLVGALTGGRSGLTTGPVETNVRIQWRGGFRKLRDDALVAGAAAANFADIPHAPQRSTKVGTGPWDDAAQTSLAFTAVKNDVAVTIDALPTLSEEQVAVRRRLVAKMIEKLGAGTH